MHSQDEMALRVCGAAKAMRSAALALLAVLTVTLPFEGAHAQLSGLTPEQLQKLQQLQQGAGGSDSSLSAPPQVTQQQTIIQSAAPPAPKLPRSRLETIMSTRAGVTINQFGYDQLGRSSSVAQTQTGAVQDSYILGPGDEIVLVLRGQENSEYRTEVDRDGTVTLPKLSPVSAAGRRFGEFKRDLIAAIHRSYVSTEGYVSVGRLRQINVLVSGEVGTPGIRTLSGLSTVVDAILISGGVSKTGSLRNVRVLRDGQDLHVDLYSVLTGKAAANSVVLTDGDRIVVPPLGPTAAIAGWVRRQGIYELPPGRSSLNSQELISLAGGLEVRGKYRLSVLRVMPDGRNQMVSLENDNSAVGSSDILFVLPAANQTRNMATLSGGMALAGRYASANTKLSELLKSPGALGDDPYTLFGIISRRDPATMLRSLIAFTPIAVLKGTQDLTIQGDDIVRVISAGESRVLLGALQQFRVQRAAAQHGLIFPQDVTGMVLGNNMSTRGDKTANVGLTDRQALTSADSKPPELAGMESLDPGKQNLMNETTQPGGVTLNEEVNRIEDLANQLQVDPLVLTNFLDDRSVNVDGAVNGPGFYLVGPDADISSLLATAGGISRWADRSSVEVTSTMVDPTTGQAHTERRSLSLSDSVATNYIVSPHDEVRVNEVYTAVGFGSVTLAGQVRHVGTYQITRGEHLSDLLMRAGGLTETAYPYGAVFLRKSAAQREAVAFNRQAQEIENQLMIAMSRRDATSKLSPEAFVAMQGYVTQIRDQKPLGRISVTADPAILASNPAADPLLEPNDVLFIPPRPFSVSVLGEVLQPGSVPFDANKSAQDYIDTAGGYSQFADESETILVLPDGSARRVDRSWFNFNSDAVPPGSSIFVARDVSGVDIHQIITETASLVSQFAVTAASLAVLSKQ